MLLDIRFLDWFMNEKQAQEMCSRVTFEDLCVMPAAVVNQVEWHLQALQGFCLLA